MGQPATIGGSPRNHLETHGIIGIRVSSATIVTLTLEMHTHGTSENLSMLEKAVITGRLKLLDQRDHVNSLILRGA